jgi:hypothetical protein
MSEHEWEYDRKNPPAIPLRLNERRLIVVNISEMSIHFMVDFIIRASQCENMDEHPFSKYFHENYRVFLEWVEGDPTKGELNTISEAAYNLLSEMPIFDNVVAKEMFFEKVTRYVAPHSKVFYEIILEEYYAICNDNGLT